MLDRRGASPVAAAAKHGPPSGPLAVNEPRSRLAGGHIERARDHVAGSAIPVAPVVRPDFELRANASAPGGHAQELQVALLP